MTTTDPQMDLAELVSQLIEETLSALERSYAAQERHLRDLEVAAQLGASEYADLFLDAAGLQEAQRQALACEEQEVLRRVLARGGARVQVHEGRVTAHMALHLHADAATGRAEAARGAPGRLRLCVGPPPSGHADQAVQAMGEVEFELRALP